MYKIGRHALFFIFLLLSFSVSKSFAQSSNPLFGMFSNVEIRIDTNVYDYWKSKIKLGGEVYLPFEYSQNDAVVELRLYRKAGAPEGIQLNASADYLIQDSLQLINGQYYRGRIKFNNLSSADFTGIKLSTPEKGVLLLPVYPFSNTYATMYPGEGDIFIGEEKSFEIVTNNAANILVDERWKEGDGFEYRLVRKGSRLFYVVTPTRSGSLLFPLELQLVKPNFVKGKPLFTLSQPAMQVTARGSRLSFLRFDEREVIWERDAIQGVELQIDNNRFLQLNKTYRIEDSDTPGGPLIAELFTVRRLTNDKVLCVLRPYNYHNQSDGYLYLKDGDEPRFITNITIVPEPKINRISILRKGGAWLESNVLYPGETVEIRLEGESLSRARFYFEDLKDVTTDTVLRNDNIMHFKLQVPISIQKKSVSIFNRRTNTGKALDIREHQRPRELDFVVVEYGGAPLRANEVTQPILKRGTIGNINLRFDGYLIDDAQELFGKQYLEVEVRVIDSRNSLVEKQVIDNIEICPGDGSPRYFAYSSSNGCMNEALSMNDVLSNKTHTLDNWSKIELIIKHRKDFYGGKGYTERIEIIKEKLVTFDVDLSIPAGLLIKKVGVDGFPGLSGISLSMLAQFSFYQKGEIQRLRPYKIGAGFLAKNAFNFNPDAERDLGIVILGSVYPTRKERRFSFALYAGVGYFLNEDRFFYLIGPGIRINL
jgi:hypothetical protein